MNVSRKLRVKFIAVFMCAMVVFAAVIDGMIYFGKKAELERDCMVYLLDINNHANKSTQTIAPSQEGTMDSVSALRGYPPHFILEISNWGKSSAIVFGSYFLAEQGVSVQELTRRMAGAMEETGVLSEYNVRYFNGIRQNGTHQIAFIDISYIQNTLDSLLASIVLFSLSCLCALFVLSLFLARWFSKPAERAFQEQRRFISAASHELKTPIAVISANVDLLSEVTEPSDPNFGFCRENIRMECDRMSDLVGAMLWLALPGHRETQKNERLDYSEIVERELLRFEVMAFEQGLSFEHDTKPGIFLRGDRMQLERVVDVLVENALKYCSPGGAICVQANKRGSQGVQLIVSSTGEAIDKTMKEDIFKPFYQLDRSRHGAGLGLSIASEIVASMNGSIRVDYANGSNRFIVEM